MQVTDGAGDAGLWARQWPNFSSLSLQLTFSGAIGPIVGCGLVMHQVARRYEPKTPNQMIAITFGPPIVLTFLLLNSGPYGTFAIIKNSALSLLVDSIILLLFTTCIYTASFLSSMLIYRLSPWHPLANYPGPLFLRITKLAIIWRTRRGDTYLYIRGLHDQYGDYVRVGPNELSIRNVEAVFPILGPNGFPRGPVWDGRNAAAPRHEQRSITGLRNWADHAERRKLWNKGFSSAALKDYEQIIIRRGKQLVDGLDARKDRVDIAKWTGYFTFDFMGDMAFGGGFELLRDGEDKEGIWTLIKDALITTQRMSQVPWAALLLSQYGPKNLDNQRLLAFATKWAKKRMLEGSSSRDLFHHLYEVDKSLSKQVIARMPSEAVTAIYAGSDSTMVTISNICYFMCQYPDYMTRLQDEIDKTFPGFAEPFDAVRLSQMSLLNAIINETLRLQPAALSGVQRCIFPGTGARMIGTHYIPDGTQVSIHTYALHRDPRYFSPHPDEFWPDRWVLDSERQFPTHLFGPNPSPSTINTSMILDQLAFTPFSFGPANCVGKNLAILEIRMIVSLILQKFGMCFAKGYEREKWFTEQEDWFVAKVGKLELELTPRF